MKGACLPCMPVLLVHACGSSCVAAGENTPTSGPPAALCVTQAFQRRRLEHTRARLRAEVDEMAEAFDSALGALRAEKYRVEADLKQAEIRQLVHAQVGAALRAEGGRV